MGDRVGEVDQGEISNQLVALGDWVVVVADTGQQVGQDRIAMGLQERGLGLGALQQQHRRVALAERG